MDDWHAYVRACTPRLSPGASPRRQLVRLAGFILLGIVLSAAASAVDRPLHLPSFLAGCLVLVASVWLNARAVRRMAIPDRQGQFLAPLVLDFEPDGLHIRREGSSSFTDWSRIQSATLTADHLFLWVDRSNAHILPLRDLPPDLPAAQLKTWLDERIGNAMSASGPGPGPVERPMPASLESAAPIERPQVQGTSSWPAALVRTLCLRSAELPQRAGDAVIVGLSLIALGSWALVDWFAHRPDPQLQLYGVPSIGWYGLLLLATAAVLARTSTPRTDLARVSALMLAVTPVAIVSIELLESYTAGFVLIVGALALLAYVVAYLNHGMRSLTGTSQRNAITRALLVVVLFGASAESFYVEPGLWLSAQEIDAGTESGDDARARQLAESLLFDQPAKIDDAIASLAPSADASPVAYFLGFAGMGEQRVFAEEIKLAAAVVGKSFGSAGRSVLLVNDARDADTLPLANPTALRYALQGIAAKMHVERDVLFLSLSSHGSEDATISVSNGPLLLNDLSAEDLADALQASGIKWRVIIVSACYSGSFIEPLKNDSTAVITASSADRTSFGCSDDRDLTYFGEAFYRDSLPKADSLRQAYEAARAAIRQREMSEAITASRPQAYFGTQIEAQLQRLQANGGAQDVVAEK